MLRVIVVSAALLPMLGGCAVTDTKMADNKGRKVECSAFGAGIIGTVAALAITQDCVDKYKKQGFHEVPAPTPAATASNGQQTPK
jgi:hypothetical protein